MTNDIADAPEDAGDAISKLMGYDKWPEGAAIAFDQRLKAASLKYLKNRENTFASVIADAKAIETEFVARVGDNEENSQQVRRIITEFLLRAAWDKDQPFETCLQYWHDLQESGFYRIERRCLKTGSFAVCCQHYGHTDMGLALIDSLIAELERLRAEPTATEQEIEYCDGEIASFGKLRARLEAQRG